MGALTPSLVMFVPNLCQFYMKSEWQLHQFVHFSKILKLSASLDSNASACSPCGQNRVMALSLLLKPWPSTETSFAQIISRFSLPAYRERRFLRHWSLLQNQR